MSASSDRPPGPSTKPSPFWGWQLALQRAPLFLSVLLLFLLPFMTQVEGLDPIYSKKSLAQILVYLILGFWALNAYLSGKLQWVVTPALLPLGVLLVWWIITLLFSPYPTCGWTALEHWMAYPLWYWLLTVTCLEAWRGENLLIALLSGALGTGLWALAQAWGWAGEPWGSIIREQFQGRVVAGMGNPEFLAGYLLLVWPLCLGLYLRAKSAVAKFFWGGVLVLDLAALALSASKAGFLGLIVGALVFLAVFWVKQGFAASKAVIGLVVGFVLFTIFFSPLALRLKDMGEGKSDSIKFRQQVWTGVGKMIVQHPFLGTGFGTFEAAYPPYRPISLIMNETERSYEVDHAHNWVLEWTAETGVVGLLLLGWFWYGIYQQWWRLFSANAIPTPLGAGVFAALTGVAVENLFDINSTLPSTLVPLLFLAAFPVALSQRFYRMEGFLIQYREIDFRPYRIYWLPLVTLLGGLCLWQVRDALAGQLADVKLKQAITLSSDQKWDEALTDYDEALVLQPEEIEALYFRGSVYADRKKEGDESKALADLDAVTRQQPDYVLVHLKKSQVLGSLGRTNEAQVEMQKAVALDPNLVFQDPRSDQARRWASAGQFRKALAMYADLLAVYPDCVPLWVDEGNCLVETHSYGDAVSDYQKALRLDPDNAQALHDLSVARGLMGGKS